MSVSLQSMTGLFQLPGVSHHCASPEVRSVPRINCQGSEDIQPGAEYHLGYLQGLGEQAQ